MSADHDDLPIKVPALLTPGEGRPRRCYGLTDEQYLLRLARLDPATGCWEWLGDKNQKGYSRFKRSGGKTRGAHCVSYELFVGPIPDGQEIDHTCRNRGCVNPAHLEPVPHVVNVRRGDAGKRQRSKTHCPRGHPYAGANLAIAAGTGQRVCRECHRLYRRAHVQRVRSAEPSEKNPLVSCACGCKGTFKKFDASHRPRRFITGHNGRGR